MSRKIVIISILMMLLCLTACTKKFDEDDVKKYIRDDMNSALTTAAIALFTIT